MAHVRIDDKLHAEVLKFLKGRIGKIGEWVMKWIREGLERDKKAK
jgi:hypothetical protein